MYFTYCYFNIKNIDFKSEVFPKRNRKGDMVSFYLYEKLNKDNILKINQILPIIESIKNYRLNHEDYLYYHINGNNDFLKKTLKENDFSIINADDENIYCKINKDNQLISKIIKNYKGKIIYEIQIDQNGSRFEEKWTGDNNCMFLSYECILINKYFSLKQQNNKEEINKFYTALNNFNEFLENSKKLILRTKNEYNWKLSMAPNNELFDYKYMQIGKGDFSYSTFYDDNKFLNISNSDVKEMCKKLSEVKLTNKYYENPLDYNINKIIQEVIKNFILIKKISLSNFGPLQGYFLNIFIETYNSITKYPLETIDYKIPTSLFNSRINLNLNNIQLVPSTSLFIYYFFFKHYMHGEYYIYTFNQEEYHKRIEFFQNWFKIYYKNIVDFQMETNEISLPS